MTKVVHPSASTSNVTRRSRPTMQYAYIVPKITGAINYFTHYGRQRAPTTRLPMINAILLGTFYRVELRSTTLINGLFMHALSNGDHNV